jgi:hypothetical protein
MFISSYLLNSHLSSPPRGLPAPAIAHPGLGETKSPILTGSGSIFDYLPSSLAS